MRTPLLLLLALGCTTTGLPGGMSTEPPPGREAPPPQFTTLSTLATPASKAPVLLALEQELARAKTALWEQPSAPHHLAFTVTDEVWTRIQARDGALEATYADHTRELATVVRVGDPTFDSGHWQKESRYAGKAALPLDEDALVLRTAIWRETQRAYRQSLAVLKRLRAQRKKDGSEGSGRDFSAESAVLHLEPRVALEVDVGAWEARLRRLSARLREKGQRGTATLVASVTTRWLATSDGTAVQTARPLVRVAIDAGKVWHDFEASSFAELPAEAKMLAVIDGMLPVGESRLANRIETWQGPVLFQAAPAAVWLHEVLGHRLEGWRQNDDDAARILARQVGQQVLPAYLTVFDDPSLVRFGDQAMAGAYRVDDDGVPARRVTLIEDGILRALLVGRIPAGEWNRSDGHGRWGGFSSQPMGRQANTVLVTSVAATGAELRERLIAEARRQKLDHGLVVHEADGLFEPPMNRQPAKFGLRLPRLSRVYVDGRPDEPVIAGLLGGRLMDSVVRILGAGDDYQAVNMGCFGDSGWVPASATSPSLLFSELRIEPSQHYRDRK
jgi:TldD protein